MYARIVWMKSSPPPVLARQPLVRGFALGCATLALVSATAFGQSGPSPTATASASAKPSTATTASTEPPGPARAPAAPARSPAVERLQARTEAVQQLVEGTLPSTTEPAELFDIDLSDESAVAVERLRLAALVQWSNGMAEGGPDASPKAASSSSATPVATGTVPSASPSASTAAGASPDVELRALYRALMTERPAEWNARRALDLAQLAFLSLSARERTRRLEQHAELRRSEEASKRKADEAAQAAESAKAEQARLLEEAKRAKTEGARLVAEEHARLLGVFRQLSEREEALANADTEAIARTEEVLTWRRRVNDALSASADGRSDALYGELRMHLRAVRNELEAALPGLTVNPDDIEVPSPGPDPLADLPEGVDADEARQARVAVVEKMKTVRRAEAAQRIARARQLMAEMESLNQMRLELLPTLTSAKYDEIAGFGPGGLDQAGAETRQVLLTLRYHLRAARAWLTDLGSTRSERRQSAWAGSVWLIKATLMLLGLLWWRRRADETLANMRDGERERRAAMVASDKMAERLMSERLERGVSFLMHIRRPLEILLFVGLLWWLLSPSARDSLEVQFLTTVVAWVSGGRLVVKVIDALSRPEVTGAAVAEPGTTTSLRLRSLELAGRTVVVFGLILALSKLLVGGGTIYAWVWSTCWFASVPIFLVIVRWWQPVIFERLSARKRRQSNFDKLLLAQRRRWTSYPAAIAGAVTLFGAGTVRWLRARLTTLTLARRLLAYLFQRDMTRRAAAVGRDAQGEDLSPELSAKLGPEVASRTLVQSVADRQLTVVTSRIELPGGGIFAVVGERGSGKSSLMTRVAQSGDTIVRIVCSPGMGVEGVRTRLVAQLGLPAETALADAVTKLDDEPVDSAILVDDAHLLLTPQLGGLVEFDAILELARRHTRNCTWVFAFDEIVWRFLERARGARPLFDDVIKLEPWSEEEITRLIDARLEDTGLKPDFDLLLEDGTAAHEADGLDIEEARAAARTNFMRLLWDYASGNPGVAMHFWRRSLGQREEGKALVRLFDAPSPDEIDKLPDAGIFVLRAVAQLGRAKTDTVVGVTSLAETEVEDALRFATAKGYLERGDDEHYELTWDWFPAVTRLLRRRQLIFKAG